MLYEPRKTVYKTIFFPLIAFLHLTTTVLILPMFIIILSVPLYVMCGESKHVNLISSPYSDSCFSKLHVYHSIISVDQNEC